MTSQLTGQLTGLMTDPSTGPTAMTDLASVTFVNATVVDQTGTRIDDVRIADGLIAGPGESDETIDATGLVISPGFVDLHTHLREPGKEEAETIETGSRAAASSTPSTPLAQR